MPKLDTTELLAFLAECICDAEILPDANLVIEDAIYSVS
jgi:hypothetical protein